MHRTISAAIGRMALVAFCGLGLVAAAQPPQSLKDASRGKFLVGAAINVRHTSGEDAAGQALLLRQFNAITPEDILKWENVHPEPDRYNFDLPDKYVQFGLDHHLYIVGHTLLWHWQTPGWVFHDAQGKLLTREALLDRLHQHILAVVGRYRGKIDSWDVVNEVIDDDGSLRKTLWLQIIGPDYIERAFQFAHEADPAAVLTYNDYSLENEPKRRGALALVRRLRAEGIPVTEVGIQAHETLDWPSPVQMDAAISDLAALGVKVAITELDMTVLPTPGDKITADPSYRAEQDPKLNPYAAGLPAEVSQRLADRYGELFQVFARHGGQLSRVTFWSFADGDSWLNNWPVKGRTNYPLLFDRTLQSKPAFAVVLAALAAK